MDNKEYYSELHRFNFGLYDNGKLLKQYNAEPVSCSHAIAAFLVAILDLGKEALLPGHYFACDMIGGKDEKKR